MPKVSEDWFGCTELLQCCSARFPLCLLGMSASQLARLPPSSQYTRWNAPFEMGRLPFDVASCLLRDGFFARLELVERPFGAGVSVGVPVSGS